MIPTMSPNRPMALAKISTMRIRTKREPSAASARAAADPRGHGRKEGTMNERSEYYGPWVPKTGVWSEVIRCGVEDVLSVLRRQRLRWYGHVKRRKDGHVW